MTTAGTAAPIPFIDLKAQRARLRDGIDAAIARVLAHGQFIMGPEVAELERRLGASCGARHCVTCANGTDALALVLLAIGLKPGDAVFVPSFTFVATAEIVVSLGATPVFVDVSPDSFNMEAASLAAAIDWAKASGLTARAVIPVDLFGQPAPYDTLVPLAERHGLFVLADAAQSFGARLGNKSVGTLGHATATSFFPSKPLGCYGDGGAIFTQDDDVADALRSLRQHGQGSNKYDNVRIGVNSRLDTLQAAILIEKLAIFEDEIAARQRIAARYGAALGSAFRPPGVMAQATSVWAQYTIRSERRDAIAAACKAAGVPTAIYYPIPLSQQTAYRHFPSAPGGVPHSDRLAREVLSLPMHPYLDPATQDRIVAAVLGGAQS